MGLHARPATAVARLVGASKSRVVLTWDGRSADASSIIELMMLAVPGGAEVGVQVTGPDAARTVEALRHALATAADLDA
jgi:phosphotransferase system HPr (HPr) family protein